jgi:hypothetical protein
MAVSRIVALCSLVEVYRRFRGASSFIISPIVLMMETPVNRLHGATNQKTAIFLE